MVTHDNRRELWFVIFMQACVSVGVCVCTVYGVCVSCPALSAVSGCIGPSQLTMFLSVEMHLMHTQSECECEQHSK